MKLLSHLIGHEPSHGKPAKVIGTLWTNAPKFMQVLLGHCFDGRMGQGPSVHATRLKRVDRLIGP
jgi:hypothetical protein